MEKLLNTIIFRYSDPEIAKILTGIKNSSAGYTFHYNQSEDSFVKSDEEFTVPAFAVHHDVKASVPSEAYRLALKGLIADVSRLFPEVFSGTRYFFDPAEILRPCFIQIFKAEDVHYLYLLRLDLNIRPADSEIISRETNDSTPEFRTKKMYFESQIIPVTRPEINGSGGEIPINRFFSSTWVGETGTGYHINGQWIDREITKLLSAVFLPHGMRSYPYYPFKCDFNTVCLCPPDLSPEGRKKFLTYLHKSIPRIEDYFGRIESTFKTEGCSKEHPLYYELKKKIPEEWTKIWSTLKIKRYLNENEMKEFQIEYQLPKS